MTEQFMAVCTEKHEHGGQDHPLTAWLDSRDEADQAGKEHEEQNKGHRWRIDTRQKP